MGVGGSGVARGGGDSNAGAGSISSSGSVEALAERWAEAQGVSTDVVCCCGIYNLTPAS